VKEFVSRIACSLLAILILSLGGCKGKKPAQEVVINPCRRPAALPQL